MPPTSRVDAARRNPVGTHTKVGQGLVRGALALGAEGLLPVLDRPVAVAGGVPVSA